MVCIVQYLPLASFQLVGHILQQACKFNGVFSENSTTKTCQT